MINTELFSFTAMFSRNNVISTNPLITGVECRIQCLLASQPLLIIAIITGIATIMFAAYRLGVLDYFSPSENHVEYRPLPPSAPPCEEEFSAPPSTPLEVVSQSFRKTQMMYFEEHYPNFGASS